MFWIYALVGTAGLVAIVPSVLRALDGHDPDFGTGFIGFAGTTFGAIGTLLAFTELRWLITFTLAMAFGIAAGVLHSELLADLRSRHATHPGTQPSGHQTTHEDV